MLLLARSEAEGNARVEGECRILPRVVVAGGLPGLDGTRLYGVHDLEGGNHLARLEDPYLKAALTHFLDSLGQQLRRSVHGLQGPRKRRGQVPSHAAARGARPGGRLGTAGTGCQPSARRQAERESGAAVRSIRLVHGFVGEMLSEWITLVSCFKSSSSPASGSRLENRKPGPDPLGKQPTRTRYLSRSRFKEESYPCRFLT